MPTDPLTGSRYPASTASPNVPQDIQNAVLDLANDTVPTYSTTTARDTAFSNWVALGNTMTDGLMCTVNDKPYIYSTTVPAGWRPLPRAVTGGTFSGQTSAGGDVLIAHGLPTAPTTAWVCMNGIANDAVFGKPSIASWSSSVLSVRVFDTRTGAVLGSFNCNMSWGAEIL